MNIFVELKKDHKKIKALLKRIKADDEAPKRQLKTFLELADLVDRHSFAEEESFYERLKPEGEKARGLAFEGYEEHHVADILIHELKHLTAGGDKWNAKFEVLKEALEHHIEEEEADFFAIARKKLNRAAQAEVAREFLELRKSSQGRAKKETWSGAHQGFGAAV